MSTQQTTTAKTLKIDEDYGYVFGVYREDGKQMIYKGNDLWMAVKGTETREMVSPKTTAAALRYINRPGYSYGSIR